MRQQTVTRAIVLARTNFQEADRILTVLTPEQGKVRIIAKGVRKAKSKMAGGIELFSVNDITYLPSRSDDLHTLISSRLLSNYGDIIKDIDRTMFGYELLKRINRATEDNPEEAYYNLLEVALESLNHLDLQVPLIDLWFSMQLLYITGHAPNLKTDTEGNQLQADARFVFDHDSMSFMDQAEGMYGSGHIKVLRLAYAANQPTVLAQVAGAGAVLPECLSLAHLLLRNYIRV